MDPWTYANKTGSEHSHQVALFMWANMAEKFGWHAAGYPDSYNFAGHAIGVSDRYDDKIPQLKWLHAIHNQGHGDAIRGAKAKAEGVKEGVADIFLPWTRTEFLDKAELIPANIANQVTGCRIYHGLYIELKRKDGGKPSDKQLEFQTDMRDAGYKCEIIHGWELARDEILRYLGYS